MKLLIVDDEFLIVEELKNEIDWRELGISDVFVSFSAEQAKEIFARQTVNIMLCDIEMPEENGLELLKWVREKHPMTQTIILTCHADFHYAKEAIRLGSLEYILKPVSYEELKACVSRAVDKIINERKLLEDGRYGKYWVKHLPYFIERFWLDILNGTIASNQKAIKEAAEERNIPYCEQMEFLPVLISVRRWKNELDLHNQKLMEFAIKNIISETILKEGSNGQIIDFGASRFLILIYLWNYQDLTVQELKKGCEVCIDACNRYLECDLSCCIGIKAYADGITGVADRLLKLENDNVTHDNCVLLLDMENKTEIPENLPDMNAWSIMLENSSYNELLSDVTSYLNDISKKYKLNVHFLMKFQYAFMQMVYSVLEQKKIQAHLLLNDDLSIKLHAQAIHSVSDMIIWLKNVIDRISEYESSREAAGTVIEKAVQYIRGNIFEDINRIQVASCLYMNPDHLDRIFKKTLGVSLTKFILNEKVNTAKKLLSSTELSISKIASSMGYKNLSRFSVVFRKCTNMNPSDYRKVHFKENHQNAENQ